MAPGATNLPLGEGSDADAGRETSTPRQRRRARGFGLTRHIMLPAQRLEKRPGTLWAFADETP